MDFVTSFTQSFIKEPLLPQGVSPLVFLGSIYSILEETEHHFLTVLSGGTIEAKENYSFALRPFDCRLLLYTRRGSGVLRLSEETLRNGSLRISEQTSRNGSSRSPRSSSFHASKKTYQLEEGTLLYLNCASPPSIEIELADSIWQYTVFFIKGELLSHYESLAPFSHALLLTVSPYSFILTELEELLQNGDGSLLRNKLADAALLNNILTKMWTEGFHLEAQEVRCPSWLLEIRQSLDIFFREPFKLEDLENRYHISKYRICREFSAAFGQPPLKYLNKRRIEAAKNLLLSTDKRIHEIAAEVGFENTNHFIHLFKKETGLTPLVYRNSVSS